jgi:hypothetical protein
MRTIGVSSLILALMLCGCSESGVGPSGSSATPLPYVQDGQSATPTASHPPAATTLSVKFTSLAPVKADSYATATIKTAASAKCSITVDYKSGPATAAGLDPKTASSTGVVTWRWKVGARTTPGSWPVTVHCTRGAAAGEATRDLTVR